MSRSSLQLALGGLVVCALAGFWLGLQGALPRDAGSRGAEAATTVDTPGPTASLAAVEAAPFTETAAPSEEPPAAESEAEPVQVAEAAPPRRPVVQTPKPPPPSDTVPASAAAPPPPPVQPPASAAPAPVEDLPPY